MKLKLITSLVLFLGLSVKAEQKFKISIDKNKLNAVRINKLNNEFVQFNFNEWETEKTIGSPKLPIKSLLVNGKPEDIKVKVKAAHLESILGVPMPVQEQDCRCETDRVKQFQYNKQAYSNKQESITVNYLGAFRGQHVSQVVVRLAQFDSEKNLTEIMTEGNIEINKNSFSLSRGDYRDYLIIGPPNLLEGAREFINWKRSRGYNVETESIVAPNNTTLAIQNLVKSYYTDKSTDFVMILGDESAVPMFRVATSGSSQTPSDLKYYTMDGAQDFVPDMLASRIVAASAADVASQLDKSIEYEQKVYSETNGSNKFIGIASNEGSNPSDDQYVKGIETKYKEVLNSEIVHLWQNDSLKSNPSYYNSQANGGAGWVTYLGHGSGSSWPSFNQSYSTAHIRQLNNKTVAKPIIIDVACQNGRLVSGYLGTTFMKTDSLQSNNPFGAVAYYGGSVNISWHPPAVMAQGIANEHLTKNFKHLGEALLAGQLYLSAKWTNKGEVVDNFEWYHLQGDPGLNIGF
jgi:hypothetical protein